MYKDIFFNRYFREINDGINQIDVPALYGIFELFLRTSEEGGKIIFAGNGGSLSIAGHLTVDCINAAGIKAVNFNDPSIITCFSNDYGYENWIDKALDCYAETNDTVVLISSSGQSKNMINGAKKAKLIGANIVTLTGFSCENPLRSLGDINLWIDSDKYNIVEMTHHIWLLSIIDYIIEKNRK